MWIVAAGGIIKLKSPAFSVHSLEKGPQGENKHSHVIKDECASGYSVEAT